MLPGWYQLVSRRSRKEFSPCTKEHSSVRIRWIHLLDENDTLDWVRTIPDQIRHNDYGTVR
jgi:hypothetical protein